MCMRVAWCERERPTHVLRRQFDDRLVHLRNAGLLRRARTRRHAPILATHHTPAAVAVEAWRPASAVLSLCIPRQGKLFLIYVAQ